MCQSARECHVSCKPWSILPAIFLHIDLKGSIAKSRSVCMVLPGGAKAPEGSAHNSPGRFLTAHLVKESEMHSIFCQSLHRDSNTKSSPDSIWTPSIGDEAVISAPAASSASPIPAEILITTTCMQSGIRFLASSSSWYTCWRMLCC